LRRVIVLLERMIGPPSLVFHKIGGWFLAAMMVLTAMDVTLRNVFNFPIFGSYDLSEFMLAIVLTSGLAYCAVLKGHVNADVIITKLPEPTRLVINTVTGFMSMGLVVLISWQTFQNMINVRAYGVTSGSLLIPVFPFVAVTGLAMVLLALVLLKDFLELVRQVAKK
jgi:TRAP-type C4-dicarboxylate transport system permease small subunit